MSAIKQVLALDQEIENLKQVEKMTLDELAIREKEILAHIEQQQERQASAVNDMIRAKYHDKRANQITKRLLSGRNHAQDHGSGV